MWEIFIDLGASLLIVIGYCIFNRKELYGSVDDSQARRED